MMTDKQIKKYCDGLDCAICNEKEPCIYKIANELEEKLSAKEKECNQLKAEVELLRQYKGSKQASYETMQTQWNEAKNEVKKLKAENEELKEKLEAVYDDCKGCPTCNEALYNANLYAKEYRKLKQTLKEIKEIAENYCKTCIVRLLRSDEMECKQCYKTKILNKINEVEDDNA